MGREGREKEGSLYKGMEVRAKKKIVSKIKMDKEVDDLTHKKENRTECGTGKKNIRVFKEGDEEQLEKKKENNILHLKKRGTSLN